MAVTSATRRMPVWQPSVPTQWQQFRRNPAAFLARWLYKRRAARLISHSSKSSETPISVVCISDTHNSQPQLPDGDVLLHAGDLTARGSFEELQAQLNWIKSLPHHHKVVIAGNHDFLLDPSYVARFPHRIYEGQGTSRSDLDWGDIIYLNNTATKLELANGRSLTIYGSPWTEEYGTWAFQYPPIRRVWEGSVPSDVDILLTHGPPKGHLDEECKGCPQLLQEIWRVRPRLVVFGHIHEGRGREDITYDAVQAAYDGVLTGDRGLAATGLMACLLLWNWFWEAVPFPRWTRRHSAATTLVNAAVAQGRQGGQQQPATVVEL